VEKYYFICHAGLGDRLEATGIMRALKQLGLEIEILWPQDSKHFPTPFEKLFRPQKDVNTNRLRSHVKFYRKRLNSFKVFSAKDITKSMVRKEYPETIMNSVRDYGIKNFQHLCAKKLNELEPLIGIKNEIDNFRKKHFTENMVGLHIRGTDKVDRYNDGKFGGPEKYKIIINELHQEIVKEIHNNKKFFLCSDNAASIKKYTDYITDRGGDVVTYKSEYNKAYFRQTSGRNALIDMLLLSKCELTLGIRSYFRFMASYIFGNNARFWNGNSVDLMPGFIEQKYIKSLEYLN